MALMSRISLLLNCWKEKRIVIGETNGSFIWISALSWDPSHNSKHMTSSQYKAEPTVSSMDHKCFRASERRLQKDWPTLLTVTVFPWRCEAVVHIALLVPHGFYFPPVHQWGVYYTQPLPHFARMHLATEEGVELGIVEQGKVNLAFGVSVILIVL